MQQTKYRGAVRQNSRRGSSQSRKPRNFNNNKKSLPTSSFINKGVIAEEAAVYTPKHAFDDFALSQATKATLRHLGLTTPSPIQDQSIPAIIDGRDVIGLANTGTGKTAAFLLPIIGKLAESRRPVTALVLAPTRELAGQIDQEFKRFTTGQKLYSTLLVGGMNINRQIRDLKRGPHIVIGTPGRVNDLIDRGVLRLSGVETFILDEADRMCDMGFIHDIKKIASETPSTRQTLCFSATMTPAVSTIVAEFMRNPLTVSVAANVTNDHIDQNVIPARDKAHKIELLTELLKKPELEKVIIFGETKFGVQRLADKLSKSGLPSVAIHGNKSQSQRDRALKDFKSNGGANIMVATDVAARGLDIPDVSHVINFDPPRVYEDYVHRIGRTGRAGKTGKALTFVPHQPQVR